MLYDCVRPIVFLPCSMIVYNCGWCVWPILICYMIVCSPFVLCVCVCRALWCYTIAFGPCMWVYMIAVGPFIMFVLFLKCYTIVFGPSVCVAPFLILYMTVFGPFSYIIIWWWLAMWCCCVVSEMLYGCVWPLCLLCMLYAMLYAYGWRFSNCEFILLWLVILWVVGSLFCLICDMIVFGPCVCFAVYVVVYVCVRFFIMLYACGWIALAVVPFLRCYLCVCLARVCCCQVYVLLKYCDWHLFNDFIWLWLAIILCCGHYMTCYNIVCLAFVYAFALAFCYVLWVWLAIYKDLHDCGWRVCIYTYMVPRVCSELLYDCVWPLCVCLPFSLSIVWLCV